MKPKIPTPMDKAISRSMMTSSDKKDDKKVTEPKPDGGASNLISFLVETEKPKKTGRKNKNTAKGGKSAQKSQSDSGDQYALLDFEPNMSPPEPPITRDEKAAAKAKDDLKAQLVGLKTESDANQKRTRKLSLEDVESVIATENQSIENKVGQAIATKQANEQARLQDEQEALNTSKQSYTDKIIQPATPTYPEPNKQTNIGRVVVTATKSVDFVKKEKPKETPNDGVISSENWVKINDEIHQIQQRYKEQTVTIDIKNELERIMPPSIFDTHLPCLVFYKEDHPLIVVNTLSFANEKDSAEQLESVEQLEDKQENNKSLVERLENRFCQLFEDGYKIANIFSLVADSEKNARYDNELGLIDLQPINEQNNYIDLVTLLMGYDVSDLNNHALKYNQEIGTRVLARLEEYHLVIPPTAPVPDDEKIKQDSYLETIRKACQKPLNVSNVEAIGQIRNLGAIVHKAQALRQDYNFFKKAQIEASPMTDTQNQIYASYAQELIKKNQSDIQGYQSFAFNFWDIYTKTNTGTDAIFQQYMQIDKLLNFYLTQANNLGWLKAQDYDICHDYIQLAKLELINTLTGMLCLTDCQRCIKQGVMPIICLFDTSELIELTKYSTIVQNNVTHTERLLIHAYMAVYGHINSLITHQTKTHALSRLESLMQGLLGVSSTHFGQKLPELPLGCVETLIGVFEKKMRYRLGNLTVMEKAHSSTIIDHAHAIVTTYQNIPALINLLNHSKSYALFAPDTDNQKTHALLLSLSDSTNQLYAYNFDGKAHTLAYYEQQVQNLPAQHKAAPKPKKKGSAASASADEIKIAPYNFLNPPLPVVSKAVFVNKMLPENEVKIDTGMQFIYRHIDYKPIDYSMLLTKLKALIDAEFDMIQNTIDGLPVGLINRMTNTEFYHDAANFAKLDDKQKYIAAYRYLNPNLPKPYYDDLVRRTTGIYTCKALRLVPKKSACPNFLYHNTPAISVLFGIQSALNKDFFYEREEWLIDLGVFWVDGQLTQVLYRMGDEVLHQQPLNTTKLDVWLDKAGLIYQTHFLHWESVCFVYHHNNLFFANTASRYYLGNAFFQYVPSSGMDKLIASFNAKDFQDEQSARHGISPKSLILKDHTEKVFNVFSLDYS